MNQQTLSSQLQQPGMLLSQPSPAASVVAPPGPMSPLTPEEAARRLDALGAELGKLSGLKTDLEQIRSGLGLSEHVSTRLELFHSYIAVFVVAFLMTLLVTPLMRRLAVANGIVDRPNEARKSHRMPVAYLGGVAVYLGILGGIALSYFAPLLPGDVLGAHLEEAERAQVPMAVLAGMTAIMLIGLFDDVWAINPRIKIGGQLLTAALLAFNDVGVKVAAGLLAPLGSLLGNERMVYALELPFALPGVGTHVQLDVVYWTGTAIIAVFVLGACNASNLIDGLDGLLSGVTAVAMIGLLVIALSMAAMNDGKLDAARIVMILAVLGACVGFLPHNFNPASIFLGDAGSMLLGFSTAVIILTLGDTGKTHLVVAGLIIYAVPIIDTTLAIIRRKMAGKSISSADDQHLHHQLKRSLGVKRAALALYGIGGAFALMGVAVSLGRGRVTYALALVLASFIGVIAFKAARRERIEQDVRRMDAAAAAPSGGSSDPGADRPSVRAETTKRGEPTPV